MTDNAIITVPEYTETAQALAELEGRMAKVVHDVTTGKGMTAAKKDVAELRSLWVALEDRRKAIKAPALERCRLIDAEAKTLEARLKGLAEPIKAQIEAEEQRKEREKAAREEAERQRIQAIHDRFNAIKALPLAAVGKTAGEIEALIAAAEQTDTAFTGQDADANEASAKYEVRLAVAGLRAALDARRMADREAEKIAAERAELENLRRIAAEQQAELDRQAEVERERAAEAARQLEAAERAARDAAEAAEREARQAEEARIEAERAERRRVEDAERAEAARKLREEQEAARAEREKLEAEKKAAAKKAREQAIATATLTEAASEALGLLIELGEGEHLVTQKLASALNREPKKAAA